MKHELKIIMTYEDGKDEGETKTITAGNVVVSIDGTPVGGLQELKFEAFAHNIFPRLEVTFPNLRDPNIDIDSSAQHYFDFIIDESVQMFEQIPNTKVSLANLNPTVNVFNLEEIGTDGFIDSYPMKKRNEPERIFHPVVLTPFKPEKD